MIPFIKYGIMVSDVEELYFFMVGPFNTKAEAKEFESDIARCDLLTTVHPWIILYNWMERVANAPRKFRHHFELEALQELRDIT
jgi:hypothetical protein